MGFGVGLGVGFPGRILGKDEGKAVGTDGNIVGQELDGDVVIGRLDGADDEG